MLNAVLVMMGGAIGTLCRWLTGQATLRLFGPAYPWSGTFTVNVVGSFLIGVFAEMIARRFSATPEVRLFLVTGFLGGFTTFSAFSLDLYSLSQQGNVMSPIVYALASVILSFIALQLGLSLMRMVLA